MLNTKAFFWGAFGGFAIEIISIFNRYNKQKTKLPGYYNKKIFWVLKFFMVIFSGLVASLYNINSTIASIHIGASTPLILSQFSNSDMDAKQKKPKKDSKS